MGKRFVTGGAVAHERHVYVERETDEKALRLLLQGQHANIRAGRQAGKTSLMYRLIHALEGKGHKCLTAELSPLFHRYSFEEGLAKLSADLFSQCGHESEWGSDPANWQDLQTSLERLLLELSCHAPDGGRLYLMLDELDSLLLFRQADLAAFFLTLRKVCQRPNLQLVVVLVSVLTPTEMMMEHPTGGISITFLADLALRPFDNVPEVRRQLLVQGFPHEPQETVDQVLSELITLTGGQPFLTCTLCDAIQSVEDIPGKFKDLQCQLHSGNTDEMLRAHMTGIRKQFVDLGRRFYSVVQTYQEVLEGRQPASKENVAFLLHMGILRQEAQHVSVANPIYERFLNAAWLKELKASKNLVTQERMQETKRMFQRRVAMLLCGGTIGMVQDSGVAHFQGAESVLRQFAQRELNGIADVDVVPLLERDGINMTPDNWVYIAEWLNAKMGEYDAFVIAHGTDTLTYSASAVAFMLGNTLERPVIFTGAQTTIDIPHGDTRDNLVRACYVAAHDRAIREVQILFGDQVLRAVRAVKTDDRTYDGFASPGALPLARVTETFLVNPATSLSPRQETSRFQPHLAKEVFYITLVPGLRADTFTALLRDRERSIDGVVISTPGLGNIPAIDPYNFRPFIEEAINQGLPVLITSQMPINPFTLDRYEMAKLPAQLGAIPAGNMTISAAYTKFAWVIGCVQAEQQGRPLSKNDYLHEIKRRMGIDYVGEQV